MVIQRGLQRLGPHPVVHRVTSFLVSHRVEMIITELLLSLFAVVLAAACSACLTWALQPLLLRYALARPNARSSHRIPTPQGAGIAVIAATLLVASAWAAWANVAIPPALVAATVLIALVGFANDIMSLPVLVRIVLQAAAVGAVVFTAPETA